MFYYILIAYYSKYFKTFSEKIGPIYERALLFIESALKLMLLKYILLFDIAQDCMLRLY